MTSVMAWADHGKSGPAGRWVVIGANTVRVFQDHGCRTMTITITRRSETGRLYAKKTKGIPNHKFICESDDDLRLANKIVDIMNDTRNSITVFPDFGLGKLPLISYIPLKRWVSQHWVAPWVI